MAIITRVLLILLLGAAPALAEWPAESVAIGARDHPKVVQRLGGALPDPALAAYVEGVARKIIAVSARPDETWRITVLDSPQVNAFALPGGYIYVTRGLLALANSESELAAVLAHEITHVTEAHVEARLEAKSNAVRDGALSALVTGIFGGGENRVGDALRSGVETALGQIGAYSKAQELAADAGGIALLRAAGYHPAAQADFLAAMAANAALEAEIAGRPYDENNTPFFANHPAPAERQLAALALAGSEGGRRGRAAYLAAIDGMTYGESARGGFVRGQDFIHPALGFTFTAAPGLQIRNAARQINILGPNRSTLIMTGAADDGDLRAALRGWAAQIPRRDRQGRGVQNLQPLEINGLPAMTGTVQMRKRGQRSTLRLTVIRFGGGLVRFAGTVRRGDGISADLHMQTVQSFRALAAGEAAAYTEKRIVLHRVEPGETLAALAAQMALPDYRTERFLLLNGRFDADADIPAGMVVKLVAD